MRKPRQLNVNSRYKVSARINRSYLELQNDFFKSLLLDIIKRAQAKYKFILINFCIYDNFIIMIIKPKNGLELPRIMQWILSVYAMKYNRLHRIHGHVWQDRYKSWIIDNNCLFLDSIDEIKKLLLVEKRVKEPETYIFCGFFSEGFHFY